MHALISSGCHWYGFVSLLFLFVELGNPVSWGNIRWSRQFLVGISHRCLIASAALQYSLRAFLEVVLFKKTRWFEHNKLFEHMTWRWFLMDLTEALSHEITAFNEPARITVGRGVKQRDICSLKSLCTPWKFSRRFLYRRRSTSDVLICRHHGDHCTEPINGLLLGKWPQ